MGDFILLCLSVAAVWFIGWVVMDAWQENGARQEARGRCEAVGGVYVHSRENKLCFKSDGLIWREAR